MNAKVFQKVRDDTDSLQSLLNNGSKTLRLTGTLIINRTLNVPTGVDIIGGILKNGDNMVGTLLTNNIFLKYENADGNKLINVRFESRGNFQLNNWANAVVVLKNCRDVDIQKCTFNLNQPYRHRGAEAIWITGRQSHGNHFLFNTLYTGGIEYAENGASNSLIKGNLIISAHSDAISGHGNADMACSNNIITQNTIKNAGFMGIEDWGNCYGSIISYNKIDGTGKSPEDRKEGMGISAVGTNTKVIGNVIRNAQLYYIESGGTGHILVANNQIVDTEFKAIGIISNFTRPGHELDTIKALSSIKNNLIQGTKEGIQVFGNFITKLIVDSNTIRNPQKRGIDVDSDAADYQVSLIANKLIFDNQVDQRIGILSYTRKKNLSGQRLIISHNRFAYNQSPLNDHQIETGLLIGTNNAVITGNIVISKNKNLNLLSFTHNAVTGLSASGNILNGKSFSFERYKGF